MRRLGQRLKTLEARTAALPPLEQLQPLAVALGLSTQAVVTEAARVAVQLREQGYDAVIIGMMEEFDTTPLQVMLTMVRVEEAAARWCGWVAPPRQTHGPKGVECIAALAALAVAARRLTTWKSWAVPGVRWQAVWVELAAADPEGNVDLDELIRRLAAREPFSEDELRAMFANGQEADTLDNTQS